ncbi:MAG: phosphatase PAP2 family protein, partial [Ilumatobacter sp.]|nr:phosphatase PAP2 family protein [Ilumatobacter sp.]
SAAFDNAERVVGWERSVGAFTEGTVQRVALQFRPLIELLDHYYVLVHFPLTIAFLVWVWWRRREHYLTIRRWFVAVTAAGLAIHVAFPLAPPRMLDGFVDTLSVYGPNIYPSDPHDSVANQFAAMPSLHFGWAAMVAGGAVVCLRGRWRHLAWLHPAITLLAIVATANHYWSDAAVAGVLVLGVWCVVRRSLPDRAPNDEGQRSATTLRPRALPARMSVRTPSRSSSVTSWPIASRFDGLRSAAIRPHAARRRSMSISTESMPSRLTPRRMNGSTVVGRPGPPVRPLAATEPPYCTCLSTLASVTPPTQSTAPAQRVDSSGRRDSSENSARSITSLAPSERR